MKAYISISYNKRNELSEELNTIIAVLKGAAIEAFVFVDNFNFNADQEKEMMQQAIKEIDECDLLIAETSDKGIGIGIEVGYARAKAKPIIYIRNKKAEHSTTVSGISNFKIIYTDTKDLEQKLFDIIHLLTK